MKLTHQEAFLTGFAEGVEGLEKAAGAKQALRRWVSATKQAHARGGVNRVDKGLLAAADRANLKYGRSLAKRGIAPNTKAGADYSRALEERNPEMVNTIKKLLYDAKARKIAKLRKVSL